jgi:phosphoglycolate phosphatase
VLLIFDFDGTLADSTDGFRLFDGIAELLKVFHRRGDTLALVSCNPESAVRASLQPELAGLFSLYRCEVAPSERKAAFVQIMRGTGFVPRATRVIGDETRDLEAARAAGIDALAVEWGFNSATLLRSAAPGRTAATVERLAGLIFNDKCA